AVLADGRHSIGASYRRVAVAGGRAEYQRRRRLHPVLADAHLSDPNQLLHVRRACDQTGHHRHTHRLPRDGEPIPLAKNQIEPPRHRGHRDIFLLSADSVSRWLIMFSVLPSYGRLTHIRPSAYTNGKHAMRWGNARWPRRWKT